MTAFNQTTLEISHSFNVDSDDDLACPIYFGKDKQEYVVCTFSIIVAKKWNDIPDSWWHLFVSGFADRFGEKYIMGGERMHGRYHMQIILEMRSAPEKDIVIIKEIKKFIYAALLIQKGDMNHVFVRHVEVDDDVGTMIGYVQKDVGDPHFRRHVVGYSDEENQVSWNRVISC